MCVCVCVCFHVCVCVCVLSYTHIVQEVEPLKQAIQSCLHKHIRADGLLILLHGRAEGVCLCVCVCVCVHMCVCRAEGQQGD